MFRMWYIVLKGPSNLMVESIIGLMVYIVFVCDGELTKDQAQVGFLIVNYYSDLVILSHLLFIKISEVKFYFRPAVWMWSGVESGM